jgi:hypothetical protein
VTTHPTDALPDVLPVAIAETGLAGVPAPANPTTVPSACRADLVQVDGHPVPVSVRGTPAEARSGLDVVACDPSLALAAGSHTVTTAKGLDTGLDVDRVVLSSDTAGRPAPVTAAGAPASSAGTSVHVVSSSPDSFDLRARTDGKPFWLVLGQSHNDGWTAKVNGHVLGGSTLVNGYANGWRIAPARAGTLHITLEWTPQRAVWIGLAISGIAVFACVLLVALGSRRERRRTATLAIAGLADSPAAQSPLRFTGPPLPVRTLAASAVAVGIGVALVSQWWIGLVVAAAMFVVPYVTGGRLLLTAGAPLALALGALFDIPELGWLALGLLAADLVVGWWRGRGNTTPPPDPPAAPGS